MIPAPPGHFDVTLLETPAPGNTRAARPFLHARLSPRSEAIPIAQPRRLSLDRSRKRNF
jgi:hypothetical protein